MFLPDRNLGAFVKRQTGRQNLEVWEGTCFVHDTFPARRLAEARLEHPRAEVVAHPECTEAVLAMADFVGSTSAIIEYCSSSDAREFIVLTESGVRYSLERQSPAKRFYFVANEQCNCSECPYMKLNTLEKLRNALRDLTPCVELSPEIMARALAPLERMLALR
jgi:quinolinate synthase